MENVQRITLDIMNNRTYEQAYSKQYDKGRILKIKLVEDGAPLDLSNSSATFQAKKPDNTVIYNHCAIDVEKSEIIIELTEQLTVVPGKTPFEIEIKSRMPKTTSIYLENVIPNSYNNSIFNQISDNIVTTGNNSAPYRLNSDMIMSFWEGVSDSLNTKIALKTNSTNKIFSPNETIPSSISFKDIVIYNESGIKDFRCDMDYIGATIVKTVTGILKIEKAVVDGDEIESTSEFTALQAALSNLAIANAEAKDYYEKMQEITGVQASETEPINDKISVWVRTSNITTATINIPEIKDEETNLTDTWSSQKISEILNSGGSTIDSEELNTALAEILI